jgi:integrase
LEAVETYAEAKREAGRRGERRGWGEKTYVRQKPALVRFAKDTAPHQLVSGLTTGQIRRWVYRDSLSHESKRTYYRLLSAWVSWLSAEGIAQVDMPAELETRSTVPTWASKDQLRAVLEALEKVCRADAKRNSDPSVSFPGDTRYWMHAAFRFAFWQALRRSEILEVRVGSIDLDSRRLMVGGDYLTKGKSDDVIPLSAPAVEIAKEWGAGGRPDGERLFRRRQADKLTRAFTEAREQAIEDGTLEENVTLHSLRHGRAIDLIRQRRHIVYVSQFLRHSSLDSTREYLQVVPRHLQDEIEGLDEDPL